jgi:hypothetical protein
MIHTEEQTTMQYMIMALETGDDFAARNDPARVGDYWNAWGAYVQAIGASGKLVHAAGLEDPATATSMTVRNGVRNVVDGPFADSKEQLGGYFVIDVDNLDEALEWAERCPSSLSGSVEVRPLLPPMG